MKLFHYPRTLEDAVALIIKDADPEDIEFIKSNPISHFGFGMALRNAWALWESTPLTEHLKKRFHLFGHGDDMSGLILHCVEQQVRGKPWEAEKIAAKYAAHWRKEGLDSKTGKVRKK